jgi:hypothetical protein
VKGWILLLGAALAAVPASAEDVPFNGRTLEVAADQEARPILSMVGTQYVLPLTQEQLLARVPACLSAQGIVAGSTDAAQGVVQAEVLTRFRASFANRILRSQLRLDVGEGFFQLSESGLEVTEDGGDGAFAYASLTQSSGIWEKGLETLVETENKVVDCLYK